jgi:hypothetical protein
MNRQQKARRIAAPDWIGNVISSASRTSELQRLKQMVADLAPFLAIWAEQYQRDHNLDGLHPVHYDLLAATGARMDSFQRATNAQH